MNICLCLPPNLFIIVTTHNSKDNEDDDGNYKKLIIEVLGFSQFLEKSNNLNEYKGIIIFINENDDIHNFIIVEFYVETNKIIEIANMYEIENEIVFLNKLFNELSFINNDNDNNNDNNDNNDKSLDNSSTAYMQSSNNFSTAYMQSSDILLSQLQDTLFEELTENIEITYQSYKCKYDYDFDSYMYKPNNYKDLHYLINIFQKIQTKQII